MVADADLLSASWFFHLNVAGESSPFVWPNTHLFVAGAAETVTWRYGAAVAVAAALALLLASLASPGPATAAE